MPVVDFWELSGYPVEDYSPGKFSAQRRLLCKWGDRYLLKQLLVGWPGQVYPYISDYWNYYNRCTAVQIEPVGGMFGFDREEFYDGLSAGYSTTSSIAIYDYAIVTAKYESPEPGQPGPSEREEDSISEVLEPTVETLPLPYDRFRWAADAARVKPDEAPVRHLMRMNYVMTMHFLPTVPALVKSLVGTINSKAIQPINWPTLTFEPETLMFVSPNIEQTISPSGKQVWTVTYRFSYKEEGWQTFWRSDLVVGANPPGAYDRMNVLVGAGAVPTPYLHPATADFQPLFPSGTQTP